MNENEIVKYDEEYYVCVSNAFIKANQNLPLNENKLLRIMISQVVITDKELKSYTTTIPELAQALNVIPDNLYRNIDKMTSTLMQQIIKIDKGKNKWDKFQLFSKCKYDNGVLTMQLHEELKPFLLGLQKLYTQYQIGVIIGMKSTYAIRVYELLKEKRKNNGLIKENESLTISIEDLRIATDTINKYGLTDFKRNVLEISAREISCNSEFAIDYEQIKDGRKVVAFKFNIYSHNSPKGEEILKKYGCEDWCIVK